jgi:hypothetical protein
MTTTGLLEAARELTSAVDGIDWSAERVSAAIRAVHATMRAASLSERSQAIETLAARVERGSLDDADGVAHVAITAGTIVETGAPAGRLGDVLLSKIPDVLRAARRFADTCLGPVRGEDDEDDDDNAEADAPEALAHVDGRPISVELFRAHLAADRGGACALDRLKEWTFPTIACLTRDRALLVRAAQDAPLREVARAMQDSDAGWLDTLLGVTLDTSAVVLHPPSGRGFRMRIDGVVTNFDLRALVEDALLARGLPGQRNPPDVLAVIRGEADEASRNYVSGAFNLYTYRAAGQDLTAPTDIPLEDWVWNEGVPDDVPRLDGELLLIVGPEQPKRSWNVGRQFSALRSSVKVEEELSPAAAKRWLERCIAARGE